MPALAQRVVFCGKMAAVVASWALAASTPAAAATLRLEIVEADTQQPLAARVYVQDQQGDWHFVTSAMPGGQAVVYDKQNRLNPRSVERHTTVSAHPCVADLEPGRYTVTVERGKEYFPETRVVELGAEPVSLRIGLRRWISMAERGWYSGETHLHRTLDELQTVVAAEDLNVAFPLSYWVTKAYQAPAAGDKNIAGDIPGQLVEIDKTHVIWPRNTEYEIFSVGERRHTIGAMFLLNHRQVFQQGVPPWRNIASLAQSEGALIDLDKLDWPVGMTLPALVDSPIYELANNHLWRTEFAYRQWNSQAPPYLFPPFGGNVGGEREWLHYTLGMYYTLLNTGRQIAPTAGTANGVHPVPAGFSRVYVHFPAEFSYVAWLDGLRQGRSFVTTGPMLFATAGGEQPGHEFRFEQGPANLSLECEIASEEPLTFAEVVVGGVPVVTLRGRNEARAEGGYRNLFKTEITVERSSWLTIRAWEDRPGGRFRFAHTAPWYVEIAGSPRQPRPEEREFLLKRVLDEYARSRGIVSAEGEAEYQTALTRYESVAAHEDAAAIHASARAPRDDADLRSWLDNMLRHHRFTIEEVRMATGLDREAIAAAIDRVGLRDAGPSASPPDSPLLVLPYPGGRHPRTGFLEGAINPQRETKVSVFAPWANGGYAVVDVPEAVFTNLGLTYLAHTHVPTIWTKSGVTLPPLEWTRGDNDAWELERTLPNGITLGSRVTPEQQAVRMEFSLRNGTAERLTNMRVQMCVMLKAALGFTAQTNQNKLIEPPYVAAQSDDGRRWIITAWDPLHRGWANPPVPCLHSDPVLPDCEPGQTVRARGMLWFYEGDDIRGELKRLDATAWRTGQ